MKQPDYGLEPMYVDLVKDMREQDLDYLMDAIRIRRNRIMVSKLKGYGVTCRSEIHRNGSHIYNTYIYVKVPGELFVAATVGECQRLLDTLRSNLPLDEALKRWAQKVSPVEQEEYTEDMARRDTQEARAQLRRDVESGRIPADIDMYADLYKTTSFMDFYKEALEKDQFVQLNLL